MLENRSYQKELLDEEHIEPSLLFQNLKELNFINRYLGGHRISVKGISRLLKKYKDIQHLMDIGCGGGDALMAMYRWSDKHKSDLRFTGADLKADCITYAKKFCAGIPAIQFRQEDFRTVLNSDDSVSAVHAALFFHHFTEEEIIQFLKTCKEHKVAVVINDLERNILAYYSIKLLTRLFSSSPLVKNDAPLSVARGFKKKEWRAMLKAAGIENYEIESCWAFRHLIVIYP